MSIDNPTFLSWRFLIRNLKRLNDLFCLSDDKYGSPQIVKESTVRKPAISEDDLMLKCIVNLILICHQNYRTSFSWILWFMFVTGAVRIYLRELKTNETGDEKHVTLRKQWCIFKMWDRFISITLLNTAEQFNSFSDPFMKLTF